MVNFKSVAVLLALSGFVTACQKAKMTTVRPMPQVYNAQPVGPTYVPTQPEILPLPEDRIEERDVEDNIVLGPDPVLQQFVPSEATPIEDDGMALDPGIFAPNQQGGIDSDISQPNLVEWFENPYIQSVLSQCAEDCAPVIVEPPKPKKPKKPVVKKTVRQACAPIQLDKQPITRKIDILFVVDTSASLKEERTAIVSQMGSFIDRLKKDVDYRIAVLPAHGPSTSKSPNNFHGELYTSGNNDPVVIDFRGGDKKTKAIQQLKHKMQNLQSDRSTAQGEVGLLSLYDALKTQKLRDQGFMRDDAALAVIFVADEQDACYAYKDGEIPHFDSSGKRDPHEQATFDGICKFNGRTQLSPAHVFEALNQAKGKMPVILTGILYTSNDIPQKSDKYAKENEMGRGYLDLIEMGNGEPVNLADRNFGSALAKLGNFSQFRMEFDNTFACETSVHPLKINTDTMNISVISEDGKSLGEFRTSCAMTPGQCPKGTSGAMPKIVTRKNGEPDFVQVLLSYAKFQAVAKPGAIVKITFEKLP